LENERRKLKSTNTELVRNLEDERIARKTIETTLNKLKDDFARQDLEKDKLISDLSIKNDKFKSENTQYELELSRTREA
jgi:ribosomal protein L17